MAIKFNCPHCKKALSVKDESLAGKKAHCNGCKKPIIIPKPEPAAAAPAPPAEDVEALAVAALADPKPDPAAVQESQTFKFACPQCGESIRMSRELAGKNAPCPECRRIIKVPQPKTKDPADWRKKDDHLPASARRDTQPVPEGAWDPAKGKMVSGQALVEAGVIPKKKRPGMTRRQKVYRWIAGGAGALLLIFAAVFAWGAWREGKQDALVERALKMAEPGDGKATEPAAEANRAAGEYYIRAGRRDSAEKAQKHFAKARDLLGDGKSKSGAERDLLLADLLVSQTDLGGGDDEAEGGRRLKWGGPTGGAMKELTHTLSRFSSSWGRLHALRLAARKLIARGRAQEAIQLADQSAGNQAAEGGDGETFAYEAPEALAVVGLELFRAKQTDLAAKVADRAAERNAGAEGEGAARPPLAPSVVALCLALGKPEPKPPGKAAEDDDLSAAGRAAGLALQGNLAAARAVPNRPAEVRFRILVMLAEATGDPADVDAAVSLLDGELNDRKVPPWLVYRLAQLAAKPGQAERVEHLAERVSDPGLKARAQLEMVRARLDANRDRAGDEALEGVDGGALAQALAREALARHNGRHDYRGTVNAVEGWEESVRPFGLLGAVLGARDDKGK